MTPNVAITQMLNFRPVNRRLSSPGHGALAVGSCTSLTDLQALWSSDDPKNPMRVYDRYAFKNAWDANVNNPEILAISQLPYQLEPDGAAKVWQKNWGADIEGLTSTERIL